jgi:DNA-binding transcriptional regulator YhcF (GntR family)
MGNKPMYRQIADALREQINAGELKPGDALPTESSLQDAFSVSRVTVRQALKLLTEEHIIESIQAAAPTSKRSALITTFINSPAFTKNWRIEMLIPIATSKHSK